MRRFAVSAVGVCWLGAMVSCDVIGPIIQFRTTTVMLVNNADFPVDVKMFIHDDQIVLESIITEVGQELGFLIPASQTMSFSRSCDELQAIHIEDANLQVIFGAGPDAGTEDVLRDGSDFGCGDTLTFTFDHSDAIGDFDVTFSVSQ